LEFTATYISGENLFYDEPAGFFSKYIEKSNEICLIIYFLNIIIN